MGPLRVRLIAGLEWPTDREKVDLLEFTIKGQISASKIVTFLIHHQRPNICVEDRGHGQHANR
jgi:hypothetical protein